MAGRGFHAPGRNFAGCAHSFLGFRAFLGRRARANGRGSRASRAF